MRLSGNLRPRNNQMTADITRFATAAPRSNFSTAVRTRRARKQLYDAAHRVGAIEHAGRPAHDLDPVEIVGRQVGQVDASAGQVERHTVEQHLDVIARAAAEEERGDGSVRTGLHDRDAGNLTQGIEYEVEAPSSKIVAAKHGGGLEGPRTGVVGIRVAVTTRSAKTGGVGALGRRPREVCHRTGRPMQYAEADMPSGPALGPKFETDTERGVRI